MFKSMEDQLKAKQKEGQEKESTVRHDVVVIEPKHLEERPVAAFTNNETTMIPIVRPVGGRINGREDCTVDGHVALAARVREYWSMRG
jgi:hypothetical protein